MAGTARALDGPHGPSPLDGSFAVACTAWPLRRTVDRENGIDAIRNYLQIKSVWINTGAATANLFVIR
jgi:hypothetical protein